MAKRSSKFTKKITHLDDMMIHNFTKYFIQTRLRLWDIEITIFKQENCADDLLEICYFYISQMKLNLDKIFYKIVCHYIIYMCDFFGEFRLLFCRDFQGFSRRLRFPPDMLHCWRPSWFQKNFGQFFFAPFAILVRIL